MAIKGLLYLYVLFVASVSLLSYKKGIYLIWISFLFIPTIILEQWIKLSIPMEVILMIGSVVSEFRFKERRVIWSEFFVQNKKAIIAYFFVSLVIVFFSQTVPLGIQFRNFLTEVAMLLFSLQTFLLLKDNERPAKTLRIMLCCAVIFNMVYCLFFEVLIGVNPAGMPLYIVLGIGDNEFITDMIDSERGGLGFRAQTIYRHSLSLGQYMLAILPLFLMKGKLFLKYVFVLLVCSLIVLSGSRSAMAPMLLILFLGEMNNFKVHFRKFVLLVFTLIVSLSFISDKEWKKFNKEIEPFVASLAFWDDQKQYENKIDGSSMELRFNQFDAALIEIADNPFFGRGYGYREYYMIRHNDLHPELLGFESVLLLQLVERGWLGLLLYFIMIYYIYKLFSRSLMDKMTIRLVLLGFMLSIVMTGVRPLSLLFVCLSCSIAYATSQRPKEQLIDSPVPA